MNRPSRQLDPSQSHTLVLAAHLGQRLCPLKAPQRATVPIPPPEQELTPEQAARIERLVSLFASARPRPKVT